MVFAQPLALLFLGLFVPVILLYLLKQRRRRVQVSALLFWDKILRDEQTVTSLNKLKKFLSLLLQLLFIALLTLALARPLLSGKMTGARRVVLILDASASMGVREGEATRFEMARDKAREVIRGLSIGDTMMLAAVGAEAELAHPFTDSKRDLMEALDGVRLSHEEGDFSKAARLIEGLAPDSRETFVYVISDGSFPAAVLSPPPRTRFAYVKVGERSDNFGITAFQVRPLPSSSRDFEIHVELVNETEEARTAPVELRMGGRLVDAYEFALPAGQAITRVLRQFSAEGGQMELALDAPDSFPLDNRAFAVLPRPAPLPVRLVTEGNLFLETALLTDENVRLEVVAPADYQAGDEGGVTVFSNWAPPNTPKGNAIFISEWPADLGLVRTGVVEKPLFTEWEREHPVNRHLAFKNIHLEKAAAVSVPSEGFEILASSFNDPLVLLREREGGKCLVVTFDTLATDLPLRVAFPIMMANAIRYLSGAERADQWRNPVIGEILSETELARYWGRDPAGERTAPSAVISPGGARFEVGKGNGLLPVSEVGFYRGIWEEGGDLPLFSVNLASRMESRIRPGESLPFRMEGPVPMVEGGFRLGWEPWFFLILMGMALSVTEWVLFHRRAIE